VSQLKPSILLFEIFVACWLLQAVPGRIEETLVDTITERSMVLVLGGKERVQDFGQPLDTFGLGWLELFSTQFTHLALVQSVNAAKLITLFPFSQFDNESKLPENVCLCSRNRLPAPPSLLTYSNLQVYYKKIMTRHDAF
jgi:hypothetical protein